ncbi:MAG: hypothetical protein ACK5FE_11435 [Cyanobacteriota bacterium]|jgi:glycosyltransferase involved in cell wall biosynthesis
MNNSLQARSKKAAHFLLIPELLYSPPNQAIIHSLLEEGYEVHIFSPGKIDSDTIYGPRVFTHHAEYSNRWLAKNLLKPRWNKFCSFSATSEDPIAIAGALAFLHRAKLFLLVDEIKSGSYRGNSSDNWKKLCRWSMRRAKFNIVNDNSRVQLLRDYAHLGPEKNIIVYPGCFHEPPKPDVGLRLRLREQWGMEKDSIIMAISGGFNLTAGADWLIQSLRDKQNVNAVVQPLGIDALSLFLLKQISFNSRLYLEEKRLSWQDAWQSAVGYDIGLAIYWNQSPQFQKMGISSNRLCMYLAMGVPVICSRQDSFRFVEDYDCGVMVETYEEFLLAIDKISNNLTEMRSNCFKCLHEYIMPPSRFATLRNAIAKL